MDFAPDLGGDAPRGLIDLYCGPVAHDDVDKAHKAWRKAEEDFSKSSAPYQASDSGDGRLTKKAAIELSELRSRADSRMQRYFKKALK